MKKYLFFPTYEAEWSLDPQYVLCGDPRTAILTPISNASTFLWEQIEPDPLTQPITILPNNNSKDVTIIIPNTISTNIKLKVTLNGDINDYRYVIVIPLIVDDIFSLSRGSGLVYNNNTLNDPINLMLAPYPPAGPQAIQYTSSSQSTGVRLLTQYYRQGYISSIDVLTNTNSFITNVNVFRNALYDFSAENRININVNKDYKFLKNWTNVKVFSEEIISIPQSIKIEYPTFIADDYANSFSRGSGLGASTITPYLVQNLSLTENINNNFSRGSGLLYSTLTPYLVQNQSLTEVINNNFSRGSGLGSSVITPYTSNIIG